VVKICKETFDLEYAKRMIKYQMDLKIEIDELERAKDMLKDETDSQ